MSRLLEAFKQEHDAVIALFDDIKKKGVHTMEGRNALMAAEKRFLKHLKIGVEELYPELKDVAASDPDLKKILIGFEREMKEISDFCVDFFDRYEASGGGIDFFRDFEQLRSILESRLHEEEVQAGS